MYTNTVGEEDPSTVDSGSVCADSSAMGGGSPSGVCADSSAVGGGGLLGVCADSSAVGGRGLPTVDLSTGSDVECCRMYIAQVNINTHTCIYIYIYIQVIIIIYKNGRF